MNNQVNAQTSAHGEDILPPLSFRDVPDTLNSVAVVHIQLVSAYPAELSETQTQFISLSVYWL